MATVTVRKKTKYLGSYAVIADVTFDSSYPTGGEAVTASQFGLQTFEFVIPANSGGYMFEFDHTNLKLKAFTPSIAATGEIAVASAASQVADTTNLATVIVRVMAIGY